ncbi:MAG: acyl-CoA thioesterase [Candidatus Eisenbacteria bacterium]|nr:acyl-CoA thioesterase [Candidatus Eisenbacteria bacterium]
MGFAYYAHYLRWFEIGRAEMLRSLGRSYRAVEEAGTTLPVVEAHVRYLRPARYDDMIAVETGIERLARASVRFGYRIVRVADGDVLAFGGTEHCFMMPSGKPGRVPPDLAALLERAPRAAGPPNR